MFVIDMMLILGLMVFMEMMIELVYFLFIMLSRIKVILLWLIFLNKKD